MKIRKNRKNREKKSIENRKNKPSTTLKNPKNSYMVVKIAFLGFLDHFRPNHRFKRDDRRFKRDG